MNKFIKTVLFPVLCLLLCQCGGGKSGSEIEEMPEMEKMPDVKERTGNCYPEVKDSYKYPVNSEEWRYVASWKDIQLLCQLPDSVLTSISTMGLLRSFLDLPVLRSEFYVQFLYDPLVRINYLYKKYNSGMAFIGRKDAFKELVSYFNMTGFDCLSTMNGTEWITFQAQIVALEGFFARPEILGQANHQQRQECVWFLLELFWQIANYNSMHESHFSDLMASIYVVAGIMYTDKYMPFVHLVQTNASYRYDEETGILEFSRYTNASVIISHARKYIKDE